MVKQQKKLGGRSGAEDLFIKLFYEVFGPEKAEYLLLQYPFVDIYGNYRFIDFALQYEKGRIAIEIDGEVFHDPRRISADKYHDDLLKQNSMVYRGWRVYRWTYRQLKNKPDLVKEQMVEFLGEHRGKKEIPPQNV